MNLKEVDINSCVRLTPCKNLIKVFANNKYIVQVNKVCLSEASDIRLSIKKVDKTDGITWDTIQEIKNAIGYEDRWAVELFPAKDEIMFNMNARHIFLVKERPDYAFRVNEPEYMEKQNGN